MSFKISSLKLLIAQHTLSYYDDRINRITKQSEYHDKNHFHSSYLANVYCADTT